MSDIVIRVENLSKKYVINHTKGQSSGDGIRHTLHDAVSAPWRSLKRRFDNGGSFPQVSALDTQPLTEEFFALRGVSFEVKRGEVLGIIGRNGAGKSTLLKILSRITEPTSGRIGIKGRVASLLEVGTGFHPELTGRENIYLNGAILGMSRAEVKSKFEEIVEFAGVESFLDTPVKRYSSGMYVRLAFAVAAHLEPEILIIDEVLAVGDAEFQKKCLGKMRDVASGGRTVLFVSHNLGAVVNLCSSALLLERGHSAMSGPAHAVAARYLEAGHVEGESREWNAEGHPIGNERVRLWHVQIVGSEADNLTTGEPIRITIVFEVISPLERPTPYIVLMDESEIEVLNSVNLPSATFGEDLVLNRLVPPGHYRTTVTVPADLLNERSYGVRVGFNSRWTQLEFCSRELVRLRIDPSEAMRSEYLGHWPGLVRPRLHWVSTAINGVPPAEKVRVSK